MQSADPEHQQSPPNSSPSSIIIQPGTSALESSSQPTQSSSHTHTLSITEIEAVRRAKGKGKGRAVAVIEEVDQTEVGNIKEEPVEVEVDELDGGDVDMDFVVRREAEGEVGMERERGGIVYAVDMDEVELLVSIRFSFPRD